MPNPPQTPPIASTPPNYTGRDDRTPLHQQPIDETGLPDTSPRALGDRVMPLAADLVGPRVPTDWWGV
jgi:hypothetical protein